MFKKYLAVISLLLPLFVSAEQKRTLGEWDVHYMVVNSTFLTPDVARSYGIVRSKNNALVNISVVNSRSGEAQSVAVNGMVNDLLGKKTALNFKEVKEGPAIYYLAVLPFSSEEHHRFAIDILKGNERQTLRFEQKLYRD